MYDVTIVGGSFAGLAAGLQLARARRSVLILDTAKPRNRFAPHSHGVLGHDGRPPLELLQQARAELLQYPTARFETAEVWEVEQADDEFRVAFGDAGRAASRRLILATGVVDQLPAIPGVAERWGVGVMHCPYCHGYEVAGRRLGVLASSPMSLHQALLIPDWSEHVTLFTNGALSLGADERASLARRGVAVVERRVVGVHGPGRTTEAVSLDDGTVVALDGLFVSTATTFAAPFAEQLGCAIEAGPSGPVIRTDARKETSVPGVFAAGDIARVPHNVTWATADGVSAGVFAHQTLVGAAHAARREA